MKLKFRLIPFIISLAIIVGGTVGLCIYSYQYTSNRYEYLMEYLHYTDYETIPDSLATQIERYAKLKSNYYQIITDDVAYYDLKKAKNSSIEKATYTETASKFSAGFGIDGVTYSNGVLHIGDGDDHYFDLMLILEATYSSDTTSWGYNYYFVLYNINYDKIPSIDNVYLLFVNNEQYSSTDELYGVNKLNQVVKEFKAGDSTVLYNTTTDFTVNYNDNDFTLHDTGATLKGVKANDKDVARIYTFTSSLSNESDADDEDASNLYFHEFPSVAFSILSSGTDVVEEGYDAESAGFEEIVRGTATIKYPNYKTLTVNETTGKSSYVTHKGVEDFIAAYQDGTNTNIHEGQTIELTNGALDIDFKKTTYGTYISSHIVVVGIISFIVTTILAFLFYMIWQEDPNSNKVKIVKAKKPKKKE